MKGLYLYCVRNKSGKASRVKGIDGQSKVVSIPYKDIEAITSAVDLREYGSKELAKRAKEDVSWIIKHAERHERVIERAMSFKTKIIPVIPMKFGTIFEKPQSLEDVLKKEYQRFKKLLKNLEGKQEWGVKVYVKEAALRDEIRKADKNILTKLKRASGMLLGMDYFGELEVAKDIEEIMSKKIEALCQNFHQSLKAGAVASEENKILKKDFAGKDEPMVLNCAFLIDGKQVKNFIKKVEKLKSGNRAFIFERTGPWPPYNFVK